MHKKVESRQQLNISCLDDLVTIDNPVRLLSFLVDDVISKGNIELPTGKHVLGRGAYSAKDLVKLCLYGYIHGITSCRELDKAAKINIEVIWLIKGQTPSYKTIADFRKNNPLFIKQVFEKFIHLLIDEKLITNDIWALDGYKVKGNAKRDMQSVKKLRKKVDAANEKIEQLIRELEEDVEIISVEEVEASSYTEDRESESKAAQLVKVTKDRDRMQSLIAEAESKDQNYISETDKDALLVTTRRGKCAGYNTQVVVDSTNHFIVGAELASVCNDTKSLYSAIKSTVNMTGNKPTTVLADRGYTNYQDIRKLYEEVTDGVRVTLQKSSREKEGLHFTYDSINDQVICPQGKLMEYKGKQFDKGVFYYAYRCKECASCPVKTECTKSQDGRVYRISENHEFIEMYKNLMKKEESVKATKRRKTIVEHVFGTLGHMMHHNGFKLRGRLKVMTELYLYSLAYNIKRLFNMDKRGHPSLYIGKLRLKCALSFLFLFLEWFFTIKELIMRKTEAICHHFDVNLPVNVLLADLGKSGEKRVFSQPLKPACHLFV